MVGGIRATSYRRRGQSGVSCQLCADRKAALSPFSVNGHHDGPGDLDLVVDVIHCIITDPGRLTKSWYEHVINESDLTPERYVELLSVAFY